MNKWERIFWNRQNRFREIADKVLYEENCVMLNLWRIEWKGSVDGRRIREVWYGRKGYSKVWLMGFTKRGVIDLASFSESSWKHLKIEKRKGE